MPCLLVIDDDPAVRHILQLMLTQAGYDVLEASTGDEGLQRCHERRIDVALVDMFMPEQDGFHIIRELRALTPPVQIIAMSGGGQRGERDVLAMARHVGATRSLQKPVRLVDLLATVRAVLAEV